MELPPTQYVQHFNFDNFQDNNIGLYKENGIIRKIIDLPAGDATKEWIELEGDNDNKVKNYLSMINAKKYLTNALILTRLSGSALIILDVQDGGELSEPVNINKVQDISILYTVQYPQFKPVKQEDNAFECNEYEVKRHNAVGTNNIVIHKSRTLLLTNNPLFSDLENKFNQSTIPQILPAVKKLDFIYTSITNMMQSSQYDVLEIDQKTIQAMQEAGFAQEDIERVVKAKLETLKTGKEKHNVIAISSGDNVSRISTNFSGYDKVVQEFKSVLATVSNIPAHILFGTEKTGKLGSSGDTELENYYNYVNTLQENILQEPLHKLIKLILQVNNLRTTQEVTFEFKPLWQETTEQKLLNKKTQAEIDATYSNMMDDPMFTFQLMQSRFQDGFSHETNIDFSKIEQNINLDITFDEVDGEV